VNKKLYTTHMKKTNKIKRAKVSDVVKKVMFRGTMK